MHVSSLLRKIVWINMPRTCVDIDWSVPLHCESWQCTICNVAATATGMCKPGINLPLIDWRDQRLEAVLQLMQVT